MDEGDTKTCHNCKREIPAVNFTIHSVHCARNIRVCPVCKEPVPHSELEEHHEKLHKLLPCKQCGESVCGTDLEDHIRDSCGHTIKSCRFCELELARRELPAHEGYCGARTEQCPDCREWVMSKYRQLHLDSNHGFLRLDDDPIPQPKKDPPKTTNHPKNTNAPKPLNVLASTSNGYNRPASNFKNTNINHNQNRPRTEIRHFNGPSTSGLGEVNDVDVLRPVQNVLNGNAQKTPLKRTNDQPQINTAVVATNKVNKDLPVSRGAVKKRSAPKPPTREPPPADPKRDLAYYSALQRHQDEERKRQEQSAYNLSVGLPPVLSAAAKLDKLRKMDALHNRETEDTDYKNKLQGGVWMPRDIPIGNILGSGSSQDEDSHNANPSVDRRNHDRPRNHHVTEAPRNHQDLDVVPRNLVPEGPRNLAEDVPDEFRNLKPMTPQEFMERFNELQLRKETRRDGERRSERSGNGSSGDRFSEIKSSLRELRRGLNEVTAPYNSTNSNSNHRELDRGDRRRSPRVSPPFTGDIDYPDDIDDEIQLPCEFCGAPVPASELVQHQTGCRPDLAQLRPRSLSPRPPSARVSPLPPAPEPHEDPVIPCEFCTESLPVYLITEHQERCRRENGHLLYPD